MYMYNWLTLPYSWNLHSILNQLYSTDGEDNGTPFQHSCLENPMDGGAW